jgi:signal recognition particle receptor subunit beta
MLAYDRIASLTSSVAASPQTLATLLRLSMFEHVNCLILVVDSTDRSSLDASMSDIRHDVHSSLAQHLGKQPLLVLANMQDRPNAMSVSEIRRRLRLDQICRAWYIHGCASASVNDTRVLDALNWFRTI